MVSEPMDGVEEEEEEEEKEEREKEKEEGAQEMQILKVSWK